MKKIIICVLLMLSMVSLDIHASSAGYYYESIDVQVEVNSKREFHITETLNVYYEEEMHGIIRSIPESGDVEGYHITNIRVDGAPFQVEESYSSKDIRIGDADVYVKGRKQYVVSYTLEHYQDYDQFHDYIYLNLIGNDFDTRTEKLTATITWPESFEVEKVTLTDGSYGNKESKKLKYTNFDKGIHVESTDVFEEYEAATVQVSFPQNTFKDAPEYHFPYTITSKKIDVVVDESQDWHIQQIIELDAHDPYVYYSINPEFDAFWGNNASLVDFKGTLDGVTLYDEEYVDIEGIGTHRIEVSYTIHTPTLVDDSMYFLFLNEYEASTDYVEINITMPNIDYRIHFGRNGDVQEVQRYTDTVNNETLRIVSTMPIQAAEQLEVVLDVNKENFFRPTPLWVYILPTLGSLLAGLSFLVRSKNRQIMVSPIHFYPPNGVNSAEAGYLIDESLSNVDMTSLIFYWAHLGCLKIHDIDKNDFMLEKVKDLPSDCPNYERTLFNSMFAYGENNCVIESQLEEKFYRDISIASSSIVTKYKKTYPIREKKANILKVVIQVLAMFIMLVSIMVGLSYELGFAGYGFTYIAFIMPFVFIYALISLLLSKVDIVNLLLTGIAYFILFVFISIMEVYRLPLLIVWGVTLVAIIVVSFMKRYTEFGLQTIGDLKGFKEFLIHAEKDQLEMLIQDNPEYYYAILPYAQALNVTKVWQDKFKDIAMEPARYYVTNTNDYRTFTNMTNSVQKSMRRSMSAPASSYDSSSSSSGGGYSGGGGGFSGGGSSGGGSGGGGSRGW